MPAVPMPDDHAIEAIARAIHEAYLEAQRGKQSSHHPAMHEWGDLDERLRAQNRDQARHNVVRFHEHGYDLVPAERVGASDDVLAEAPDELVDRLAKQEHDRWARAKMAQGYGWGVERNDDADAGPLTHPDLCAWEELDDDTRAKDEAPLRTFPAACAASGWALVARS